MTNERVATFANNTLTDNTNQTPPTPSPPNSSYLNPYQLHIPRAIAEHQRAIVNDPDADHSSLPPLIPDSDTEDEANTVDTDSVPPLIRLDEDNQPIVAHAIDLSIVHTENASRNIPNTVCGLVGTFLISAKMFLIPCVLWAISGIISGILRPVPDIMWNHFTMFLIWRCLFSYYDNLLLISSSVLYL